MQHACWVGALDIIKAIDSIAVLVTVIDTVHRVVATARIGQWPRVIFRNQKKLYLPILRRRLCGGGVYIIVLILVLVVAFVNSDRVPLHV